MQVSFSVEKTHLAFFLVGLVVVIGVGLAVAAVPDPGHSYSQIELPAGAWTGLNADKVDGFDGSQLCKSDGTNCPAAVHVSGGLYGWCREYYRGTSLLGGCMSEPPASCSGNACVCGTGYTKVETGRHHWSPEWEDHVYWYIYYSCHKN